jgi:hypothetical protein
MKMQDDKYKYRKPDFLTWLFGIGCILIGSSKLLEWFNNGSLTIGKYNVVISGNQAFIFSVVILVFGLVVLGYCVYACKFRK